MEAKTVDDPPGTRWFEDLPPTLTVPAASALLGVGRTLGYEAARRGQIPTLRIGNRLVVPTQRLLRMLEDEPVPASSQVAVDRGLSVGPR